ncbi:MAG: hypothetical protein R2861_04465 [Desulfobacterales bacterium]
MANKRAAQMISKGFFTFRPTGFTGASKLIGPLGFAEPKWLYIERATERATNDFHGKEKATWHQVIMLWRYVLLWLFKFFVS